METVQKHEWQLNTHPHKCANCGCQVVHTEVDDLGNCITEYFVNGKWHSDEPPCIIRTKQPEDD